MIPQQDPFLKWKQSSPDIQTKSDIKELPQQQNESPKEDPFSKWKKDKEYSFEGENDLDREIERNIAQQSSRMGETILGAPGDIYSFAKSMFGFSPETNLPTSKSLRELSEKYSQGYTKPKNEEEDKAGEVMSDIASFMMPGSGQYNIARNIGIPVVANLVKEGLNYTGKEKLGEGAKIGTMILLDLLTHNKGGAKAYAGSLFDKSESLIQKGDKLISPKLDESILHLEKSLMSGGTSPSKEKAITKVNEIIGKIKKDGIEVTELVDFRKTINEIIGEMGGFSFFKKENKKKAIFFMNEVKGNIISALEEYGAKNKEFGKVNRAANEAWAAYEGSNKLSDAIGKITKNSLKSGAAKALFGLTGGLGAIAFPAAAAKTTLVAGPVYIGNEAFKVFHQVVKSPVLRKYYGNVLKGAASGNTAQVAKNAKLLDDALEKSEVENQGATPVSPFSR